MLLTFKCKCYCSDAALLRGCYECCVVPAAAKYNDVTMVWTVILWLVSYWHLGMSEGGCTSCCKRRPASRSTAYIPIYQFKWPSIDLWGHAMGVRHWLDVGDEIDLWARSIGACIWIGAMELICGGEPWRCTTLARSGWGYWFMWARHEGARYWLDWGYGIDSWGVSNDKVLYGCWIWMTIPCVLCLALR